jgi:rfaE bifunctional protein nucleotidyltransferase chain/domain
MSHKVVLANGVFDVLHYGHLVHLQQARAMGDRLIVSVTRDKHVNKGFGRPVFGEQKRAAMLKALRCVSGVVFSDGAIDALEQVKPDIFVKGIEYKGNLRMKPTERYCREHGIKVQFTNGIVYSSSALLAYANKS